MGAMGDVRCRCVMLLNVALCLRGKTECSICGVVLRDADDVVSHPHILATDHRLGRFSESSMHRTCYERWEHHSYFEAVLRKAREIKQSRPGGLVDRWGAAKQLSPEEREQLSAETESWSRRASDELAEFVAKLGDP